MAEGGAQAGVINPATGKVFANVPEASRADLNRAVSAAAEAFKTWRNTSFQQRAFHLNKFADAIMARRDEFARALTMEQGKPLARATSEVSEAAPRTNRSSPKRNAAPPCGNHLHVQVAGVARKIRALAKEDKLKPKVVSEDANGRVELHYLPRGVVGGEAHCAAAAPPPRRARAPARSAHAAPPAQHRGI